MWGFVDQERTKIRKVFLRLYKKTTQAEKQCIHHPLLKDVLTLRNANYSFSALFNDLSCEMDLMLTCEV